MNKELLQNVLGVGNYFSEKVKMMALELKAADEALANMTADRDSCIYCIGGADMSKELLQQALDALTKFRYSTDSCDRRVDTVIKALEKAIAKSADTGDKMAYEGAQEDLLIWKRRALEAEKTVREQVQPACLHDETERLGAIWTRCTQCEKKWADDAPIEQPVPMRKTTREEKITRPGVYELPLATATLSTAPACLNTNDKAMWVLGWNECLNAAISSTKETS